MSKKFLCAVLALILSVASLQLFMSTFVDASGRNASPLYVDNSEVALKDQRNINIYRALKEKVAAIAENGGSSVITLDTSVIGDISVPTSLGSDMSKALSNAVSTAIDLKHILNCLIIDCPYELYWYDKSVGLIVNYSYIQSEQAVSIDTLSLGFGVSVDYRAADYDSKKPAVTTELSRVKAAIATAKNVVEANKNKTDVEKLQAYCKYICDNVAYNSSVDLSSPYGDPWQLIYVFDGNDTTNVLCEGYVKAFQYLCELTKFEGNVKSYIVTGHLSGGTGAGPHMWNVVITDEGNFIADVTNSDAGTVGKKGDLFMNAFPKIGNADGYTFDIGGGLVVYTYNDICKELCSADIRTLKYKASKITGITLTPAITSLERGSEFTFNLSTNGIGDYDKSVIWSIDGAQAIGTQIVDGVLTIAKEETAKAITITVTSVENNTISAKAVVNILAETPKLGDVNRDGKISPLDASLVLQYNAKLINDRAICAAVADVNGDDKISPLDASLILQFNAKLINDFPANIIAE